MMRTRIYEHVVELPDFPCRKYFHSRQLMQIYEDAQRQKPYMIVVSDDDEQVVAHLLAVVRQHRLWIPPFLMQHAWIIGEGEYERGVNNREEVFDMMVSALKNKLQHQVLYFELLGFEQKMFGYGALRRMDFFPVKWMSVHNSLHSAPPQDRISERLLHRIENGIARGAVTKKVENDEEFNAFFNLLSQYNWLKPYHYQPPASFFRSLMDDGHCQIFITLFHGHVIGAAVCIYSENDVYLWYSAARRKSMAPLHPLSVTLWKAMTDAHEAGYDHVRFLNVGMPFRRNPYRDFILRFGGKECSTYRWFLTPIKWVNHFFTWLWRIIGI